MQVADLTCPIIWRKFQDPRQLTLDSRMKYSNGVRELAVEFFDIHTAVLPQIAGARQPPPEERPAGLPLTATGAGDP